MITRMSLSQLRMGHPKAGSSLQTSGQRVQKRSLPALQQSNIATPCVSRHFLEARSSRFTTSCIAIQYGLGADATQVVDSCADPWMLPQALTPQKHNTVRALQAILPRLQWIRTPFSSWHELRCCVQQRYSEGQMCVAFQATRPVHSEILITFSVTASPRS